MNKQTKKLIPELRFPDFVDELEWEEKTIDSVGDVITGGTPSKDENEYWGGDFVWITAQDFKTKYITKSALKLTQKGKKKSRVIPENSVLVTCIASIGLNGINKVECATNQQINSIVCNSENYFEFIYYAISHNADRLKSLAGQTAVPIINKSTFEKFTIQKPKSTTEQQKIADCLSSIDELINAHNEKLENLKTYKKGLMQNLFPQNGEKMPKLRFKEFEKEQQWEFLNGNELFESISNKKHNSDLPILAITQEQGAIPRNLINYNVVVTEKSIESYKVVEIGDFIISLRSFQGGIEYSNYKGICSPAYIILRKKSSNSDNEFYKHYFKTDLYIRNLNKNLEGLRDGKMVSYSQFSEILIPNPNLKEQQKIAYTLSSVDELIKEQTNKLEQLKLHKKGLMYGLFPRVKN